MTPDQLAAATTGALDALVAEGVLALPDGVPGAVVVERPRNRDHGDYATNVALQLAEPVGRPPREVAGLLAERLRAVEGVASVDVAGPGFLNLRVSAGAQGEVAARVVEAGPSYGTSDLPARQLVDLLDDGRPVRMSERAGTVLTLEDLVDAVGVDAARYALARCTSDTTIDIDLAVWTKASSDNPVYYVQYAHARLAAILRHATDLRLPDVTTGPAAAGFEPSLLDDERERELLRALADFPRVVATAARLREAHLVARYLEDTAAAFHRFHDTCRVLPMGDEEPGPLHVARLVLVAATRVVLANGLGLLGVSAPERM